MATFDEISLFKAALQRKGLAGAVLKAPMTTAALTTIHGAGGALTALTGYETIGKLTADGITRSGDVEVAGQRGWGDFEDSRRDVTGRSLSLSFAGMETNRAVLELFDNTDLSTVEASATTGELTWDAPNVPVLRDWRILVLVRDVNKANGLPIYHGLHLPRATVRGNGDQNLNNDDSGINYPLIAEAQADDTEGTPMRTFWGGAGLAGILADMGFSVAGA